MAILIQVTSLMLLFGIIYSWPYSVVLERHTPLTYVHTSVEEGTGSSASSSSMIDEINRMMASMHQRFEHMFGWPSFPLFDAEDDYDLFDHEDKLSPFENLLDNEKKVTVVDDLTEIRKKLDNVVPVCTTTSDSPTTISPRKSRRKKIPTTKTTKCIKELTVNGQTHFSEEITTIDDKDEVIKQSKSYGLVSVDADQNKL
jgi:hypothetical protein